LQVKGNSALKYDKQVHFEASKNAWSLSRRIMVPA